MDKTYSHHIIDFLYNGDKITINWIKSHNFYPIYLEYENEEFEEYIRHG